MWNLQYTATCRSSDGCDCREGSGVTAGAAGKGGRSFDVADIFLLTSRMDSSSLSLVHAPDVCQHHGSTRPHGADGRPVREIVLNVTSHQDSK